MLMLSLLTIYAMPQPPPLLILPPLFSLTPPFAITPFRRATLPRRYAMPAMPFHSPLFAAMPFYGGNDYAARYYYAIISLLF